MRFGIPSLDQLVSGDESVLGIDLTYVTEKGTPAFDSTSMCIIGPDGTGKSVLALHLASYYAADHNCKCTETPPRILYASTDLRYEKALKAWANFMLGNPLLRPIPFYSVGTECVPVMLLDCVPGHSREGQCSLTDFLSKQLNPGSPEIGFVNLASNTAGDDWGYLNRILASLTTPEPDAPPHLLILDAVEGLEAFAGTKDAYGESRTRRARIAQLMRTAAGKCNVVLIVEESNDRRRLPEDYITDIVLRLRSMEIEEVGRHYLRRTIEVEKARGQTHVRGRHPFTIRTGKGSTTGPSYNPDDPPIAYVHDAAGAVKFLEPEDATARQQISPPDPHLKYVAYIHVFHSLHYINRRIMEEPARQVDYSNQARYAGFGLPFLDNMLGVPSPKDRGVGNEEFDSEGLPCGSVTALIGENGTHRTRLTHAFLSQAFKPGREPHAVILITPADIDSNRLASKLAAHLDLAADQIPNWIQSVGDRIICRRLEVHDLSSAALFHIVRQCILAAQRRLGIAQGDTANDAFVASNKIRIVIGNLEVMRATYPDVEDDPLFLPALNFWLTRNGVPGLLHHTDAGGPDTNRHTVFTRVLCGEVSNTLFVWHVPFFGEDRIAVAAIPAITDDRQTAIRELRAAIDRDGTVCRDRLFVDPHFEMYTGLLERETPSLVPLVVRQWGAATQFEPYYAQLNTMLKEVFTNTDDSDNIISATLKEEYEDLRRASHLKGDMRLDHTLVMQVDEFWVAKRSELRRMEDYLLAETTKPNGTPNSANDPYRMFQPTRHESDKQKDDPHPAIDNAQTQQRHITKPVDLTRRRETFFDTIGYSYVGARQNLHPIDRIPYLWDFGFLLLRRRSWEGAGEKLFVPDYTQLLEGGPPKNCSVRDVWRRLVHAPKLAAESSSDESSNRKQMGDGSDIKQSEAVLPNPISWRVFLHACSEVARSEASDDAGHAYPFDVHMLSPQTFSCLVLEVWASIIHDKGKEGKVAFARRREDLDGKNLVKLLEDYKEEFFLTWLLLGEVFTPAQFGLDWLGFAPRPAHGGAVASRHWYSTATCAQESRSVHDPLTPVRLPGHYSVRGDWFLAIASGSRSTRLGERAIDLMSSRRANILRLQVGLGLPTRHIADDKALGEAWTRLFAVREFGQKAPITYADLLKISAASKRTSTDSNQAATEAMAAGTGAEQSEADFRWIWRYAIPGYDRQVTLFSKMLSLLLINWQGYWQEIEHTYRYRSGFEAYDRCQNEKDSLQNHTGYLAFVKECDSWIKRLNDAAFVDGSG
jgi:KaiC/GvpD/RAD55 family RecA-like ATPase